jgi:hypothetical protein
MPVKPIDAQNQTVVNMDIPSDMIAAVADPATKALFEIIAQRLKASSNQHAAQAGFRGTVGVRAPRTKDLAGNPSPAMTLAGGRIDSMGDPIKPQDGATKNYVDTQLTCTNLQNILIGPNGCMDIASTADLAAQTTPTTPGGGGGGGGGGSGGGGGGGGGGGNGTDTGTCDAITGVLGLTEPVDLTTIYEVKAQDEFLYVTGFVGGNPVFEVYRVGSPTNPNVIVKISSLTLDNPIPHISVLGHSVWGVTGGGSASVVGIDVSDPYNPVEGSLSGMEAGAGYGIHAEGPNVFVATDGGIQIVDATNPNGAPSINAAISATAGVRCVYGYGEYIYAGCSDKSINIFGVANTLSPTTRGVLTGLTGIPVDLMVYNSILYCVDSKGVLYVINIDDLDSPSITTQVTTGENFSHIVAVSGVVILSGSSGLVS